MEPKVPFANCEQCPLQNKRIAKSQNPTGEATIALVSRSPGNHDVSAGRPFAGPSGQVVDYLLGKYGVTRDEILTTNVVLCQTDSPSKQAIECCKPRLDHELAGIKTVIAAGTEAVSALTTSRSVHAARGYVHFSSNGTRIIAANNPALVMRESDVFPTLITDFRLALDPIPEPTFPEVDIINDPIVARDLLRKWIRRNNTDTSTDLEWSGNDIYCAGFSEDGKRATVFGRNVIKNHTCFGLLKQFYESDTTYSCWHIGKSDTSVLWRNGIHGRIEDDTFFLSYVLDEEPGRHSLDYLLQTELGWPNYTPESVNYFKKNGNLDYYIEVMPKIARLKLTEDEKEELRTKAEYELYKYNGWDAAGTQQLRVLLTKRAIEEDVYEAPYKSILLPATNAFRDIELRGFRFDANGSADIMEAYVLPKLRQLTERMQEISGQSLLNPKSTKQMSALYYDVFGLKHGLKNKAKISFERSTGKEVREEIEGGRVTCKSQYTERLNEFAPIHRSFAKVERQRSNYFQSLIDKVADDGRIHPWFNLGGTATGRTSSTEPNFQNITREGVEGIPSVRTLFLPSDGHVIISADYSQAELRTCAVLSQDPALMAIYEDDTRSLHKERAAAFYGDNYTKEEYVKSKNINFGVTYGQSAMTFAQMYHMPEREAQAYINSWWKEFPTLKKWVDGIGRESAQEGVIVSPLKYKRRFHLITKDNIQNVFREAVNFLPQNTAGGFTICAVSKLVELGVPIVNTVHDSIIADVPISSAMETARLMKSTMEEQPRKLLGWTMPFTVDVSMGETWASVKEIEV